MSRECQANHETTKTLNALRERPDWLSPGVEWTEVHTRLLGHGEVPSDRTVWGWLARAARR